MNQKSQSDRLPRSDCTVPFDQTLRVNFSGRIIKPNKVKKHYRMQAGAALRCRIVYLHRHSPCRLATFASTARRQLLAPKLKPAKRIQVQYKKLHSRSQRLASRRKRGFRSSLDRMISLRPPPGLSDVVNKRSTSPPAQAALAMPPVNATLTPAPGNNDDGTLSSHFELQKPSNSLTLSSVSAGISSAPEELRDHVASLSVEKAGVTRAGSPIQCSKPTRESASRFLQQAGSPPLWHEPKRRRLNVPRAAHFSSSPIATPSSSPSTPESSLKLSDPKSTKSHYSTDPSTELHSTRNPTPSFIEERTSGLGQEIEESNLRAAPLPARPSARTVSGHPRAERSGNAELEILNSFCAKVKGRDYSQKIEHSQVDDYLNRFLSLTSVENGFEHEVWKDNDLHSGFGKYGSTCFHARGITQAAASSNAAQPGSNYGSEAPSPSTKGAKSTQGGKSGKGQGKSGKQNKGRNGGGGSGRDRESPEPPPKVALTTDDSSAIKHIRARQSELRRFYSQVLVQQKEALELMTSRDLSKLLRKHKAHTKVPEFKEVMNGIDRQESNTMAIIKEEYEMQVEAAEQAHQGFKDIVEDQLRKHCEDTRKEHVRGAQGDLIIFYKAHRAAGDETKTDNGSDIEPYFPRYHELPEPDARPRGYTSSRILDEKPFKEHLSNYDEQAQREVIDKDIVGPVAKSIAEQNVRRQADEERRARLDSLVSIAEEELREKHGYLNPPPLQASENPQFALSRLADCAEFISRTHPEQAYIFMPTAPRDVPSLPRHHLERVPPPRTRTPSNVAVPPPPAQQAQPQSSTSRKSISHRQRPTTGPSKPPSKDDESRSQSSSSTSTPLLPLAPAPARMPPLSISSNHLHHHHLPPPRIPPPPTSAFGLAPSATPFRPPALPPLNTSISQSSPSPTPTSGQPLNVSTQGPPLSPGRLRHGSNAGKYPLPPPQFGMQYPGPPPPPPPPPPPRAFSPTAQQPAPFSRPPPAASPVERTPLTSTAQTRFSVTSSSQGPPRGRAGGPRREPGQITFTPTQTPNSERFKNPSNASQTPQLPGQSVLRPGLASNTSNGMGTGKIGNTFVNAAPDANSRAQQAADAAKANANLNQVQGAGPKGGRRLLLPKGK